MKRTDLIRRLEEARCILVWHGGNYDWYRNPRIGRSQPMPRREIAKFLARHILRHLGDPP